MRAWRIVLLPVLLACAIGLGTSHIGHAGLLSLHLATAHHDTPPPPPADPRPAIHTHAVVHVALSDEAHEHSGRGAGAHEHPARHGGTHEHARDEDHHHGADRPAPSPPSERPIANAPHEHGGLIHTHDPRTDEELVLPSAPYPEFYLPASAASPPRVARNRSRTPWIVAAPDQAGPPIESPPPQLPG
jgi:hypothetical protein